MKQKKILILDYSVDQSETSVIKQCLPQNIEVSSLYIDTEASFPDDLIKTAFTHVIHTGSALSITENAPFTKKVIDYIQKINAKGIWQMGICYGHQLLCKALVGDHVVRSSPNGFEVGWEQVSFTNTAKNFLKVREQEIVWQHHFDEVIELPKDSEILATNTHTKIQAYINYERKLLGTQFHPEFNKKSGNDYFLKDRKFLEKNHKNVDTIINEGPSFDSGNIFFDFFLKQFPYTSIDDL
ncbi:MULTISPECIES: type 1 glutamine amidotransferase [Aquimarina]|uniref:type 1 glutamine amidotransferase n=1 Tax=Aquimarina TaxID=290174 RepID=UPI000944793E|nr:MULTISPECIES: type 1 glutamine amidotransferase [Aquimarina]